jgi:hypothetical protein
VTEAAAPSEPIAANAERTSHFGAHRCVRATRIPRSNVSIAMARLPTSGATVVSPSRNEADFRRVLRELCPKHSFSGSLVEQLYSKLSEVIGLWVSEKSRLDVSLITKRLRVISEQLDGCATTLGALETGLHQDTDIAVASQLTRFLALNPEIGSIEKGRALLSAFQSDAARIAHACLITATALDQQPGKAGKPKFDWYDDFASLLIRIAKIAGVKPNLEKDRIDGRPKGWLLDAARSLEGFLETEMRSKTDGACCKRLERAKRRLQQRRDKMARDGAPKSSM